MTGTTCRTCLCGSCENRFCVESFVFVGRFGNVFRVRGGRMCWRSDCLGFCVWGEMLIWLVVVGNSDDRAI